MMILEDSMPSFRGPSNHNRDVDSIKGDEEEEEEEYDTEKDAVNS